MLEIFTMKKSVFSMRYAKKVTSWRTLKGGGANYQGTAHFFFWGRVKEYIWTIYSRIIMLNDNYGQPMYTLSMVVIFQMSPSIHRLTFSRKKAHIGIKNPRKFVLFVSRKHKEIHEKQIFVWNIYILLVRYCGIHSVA